MLVYGVEERRCCAETTRIPAIIPYAICKAEHLYKINALFE